MCSGILVCQLYLALPSLVEIPKQEAGQVQIGRLQGVFLVSQLFYAVVISGDTKHGLLKRFFRCFQLGF